ncbi:hypothetical protein RvY_08687 [Ramazzottius varieornatus]|uniref:Ribosomal RNA-processing protein 8 n=1 Tax=Ramazzottius varieornatus TaxID=947166 RepID=A0A1D1V6Q7_RAMVA|nr:hypothetical protein RvY_08687 [Ramazzottius varieornatus]
MFASAGADVWGESVSAETSSLIEGLFGTPKALSASIVHRAKPFQKEAGQNKSRKRQRRDAELGTSAQPVKKNRGIIRPVADELAAETDEVASEVNGLDSHSQTQRSGHHPEQGMVPEAKQAKKRKTDTPVSYLEKAEKRLKGSRFRQLNEKLYTCTGQEAMKFFRDEPEAFAEYHDGYREQTTSWPKKPLLQMAEWLKRQPKNWVVADMGCGEAELSTLVPQKCHSFDLQALNDRVTVCEMSSVPLRDSSVNVVVFCLSLMGTNVVEYLCEAWRILRTSGVLKIAEVGSRFDNLKQFIRKTERLGFRLRNRQQQQFEGNFFVLLDFDKVQETVAVGELPEIRLKPCLYKRR